jgi:CHAT domain-containing protein
MGKYAFVLMLLFSVCLTVRGQSWSKTDSLSADYMQRGIYDSALYYANEAAAIVRGESGENSLRYCRALRRLAAANYYLENYRKAKYFILKEVSTRESLKKNKDRDYISANELAALICRKAGSYEEALVSVKKADNKALDIFNPEGPLYADILYAYAGVYHDMGCAVNDMVYLNQEKRYLERAEAIFTRYGERKRDELLVNISDQAAWNNNVGNSPKSEALYKNVAKLCKDAYGSESRGYAVSLNNLAVQYYNSGNYRFAEKYFVEAADIFRNNATAGSRDESIVLNNLGSLYNEIGNYAIAETFIKKASSILEKEKLKSSPDYAVILNNLGTVSLAQEYYASPENKNRQKLIEAGRKLKSSDSVFTLNCQKPHPFWYSISCNLAVWYSITGDKQKSADLMTSLTYDSGLSLRVVGMMPKMNFSEKIPSDTTGYRGPDPVIIPVRMKLFDELSASSMGGGGSGDAGVIVNALLKLIMGKASNIRKAVGEYHPAYGEMLKTLIAIYGANEDLKTEEELSLEYINVINHRTLQDFSFLSESEKEMYYQTRLPDVRAFTAYSMMRKKTNPLITRYAYNNILLHKGLMLKSSTAMRVAILNSNNPVLLKQYDDWIALQKEISVLNSTPVDLRTKDVTLVEKQANDIEKSLVASSQDFSDYRKGLQITWEDVRKSLKPDEAAIEFTDYKKMERDGGDAVYYCAMLVRSGSEAPEMVKLCSEAQLKAVLNKGDQNDVTGINDIYGTAARKDDRLYSLVWKPLEQFLEGVKNVYLSPSGLLNKISFPAISNGRDVYLCDNYSIQIKGSTGNVAVQTLFSKNSAASALVFGGIEYSKQQSGSDVWTYLKGTKDEGDVVDKILEGSHVPVKYLSGSTATETFFKQNAGSFNILHLATHGFFFGDPGVVRMEEKNQEVEYGEVTFRGAARGYGVNSFVNNENPLMRSGLVLAGANDVWVKPEKGETDDGVLTAQEVTQIDMRKSDLVVLSACETGLGDIRGNEGVYGLQRALKMAGVKYIIMSLWSIPDRETVEFMQKFYSYLVSVRDIKTAFYKAQKEMRSKYDPYFWGAFVLLE